ncbi:hypothetical protein DFH07DRAFT_867970 [Mycena maculata]|uniref:Histone acetyltransferase n=1 Tax=Mycena maculata TaxID=230809 RepID=A0AAD7J7S3_9AGAR|nr:hypothetical protein DFH07DRAFT_867970 [Mycena maculata]
MRGLAIPANTEFDREPSNEYGTPFSANDDNIPIDPALGGTPIDPALIQPQINQNNHKLDPEPPRSPPPEELPNHFTQYSEAPQGDPFAPQPEYRPMPQEPPPPPPPKPARRKRGSQRGHECGFCGESNSKNKKRMATCHDCGRSGWHMDCLDPPVAEMPSGKWYCPFCPNAVESERGTSVASTSRSVVTPKDRKGKGKAAPIPSDDDSDDEDEEEEEEEEEEAEVEPVGRTRVRRVHTRGKKRTNGGQQSSPSRPAKRLRIHPPNLPTPSVRLRVPKPRGRRQEEEEVPHGLFDDILAPQERDTNKTTISPLDIQRFERSRAAAEAKLGPRPQPQPRRTSEIPDTPSVGPSIRPLRSSYIQPSLAPSPSASPAPSSTMPGQDQDQDAPLPLRISTIRFGQYDVKTWYNAPFPEEYANIPDGRLWICEFCLKYMKSAFGAQRHRMKCKVTNPPGDEIYRDQTVVIFEVDGRKNKIYCQNLCLLSKMFLDHKSLFYDVEPFLFYVIAEADDVGARFVGYFSKEKRSPKDFNVSCIMTLPVRQRQGWGNLLIDFSYLLSKKERRLGSPEKPLSALGALGYMNYWTLALMRYLATAPDRIRLEDICMATSMTMEDVHTTLTEQGMITVREVTPPRVKPSPGQSIKFPKGRKNGVARRHLQRTQTADKANVVDPEAAKRPYLPPTQYEIRWDRDKVTEYLQNWEAKGYLTLKPEKLQWSPYIFAKMQKTEALEAPDTSALMTTAKLALNGNGAHAGGALLSNGLLTPNGIDMPRGLPSVEESVGELPTEFPPRSVSPAEKDQQMELDREFATQLAADTPRTRLRTRSSQSLAATPTRKPSYIRPEKGKQRQLPQSDDDDEDEDDAVEQPGRHLRSRGVAPDLLLAQSSSSKSTRRPASPKKRRRVDSSSEEEEREEEEESSSSMPPVPLRTSSPVLNGQNHQPAEADVCAQEPPSQAPNGMDATRQPVGAVCANNDERLPRSVPPIKTIVVETGGRETPVDDTVKSEDLGTPLTSLPGRQSTRSDDTVVMMDLDLPLPVDGKDGQLGMLAVVAAAWEQQQAEDARMSLAMEDLEDGDADAEGEEDDAEGEEDGEGKSSMQYSHISSERRDLNLQDNPNSSIGQALGHSINVQSSSYSRQPPEGYRISQSPPTHSSTHAGPSHSLTFSVNGSGSASSIKRKQADNILNGHVSKRRREAEESVDPYEDAGGAGAKHWTDEEKTLLFQWLMGPSHDDHWNALRATKNSCLRECATEVYGGKKTYQALKGCYERNFNLFKQIYSFETYHAHAGNGPITSHSEADRLRDYERRLGSARRAGCDVGNITARTIDHWHRTGWYDLFYRRWHGDPATTKPVAARGPGSSSNNLGDDPDLDDDQTLDFSDSPSGSNHLMNQINTHPPPPPPPTYINPHQTLREPAPPPVVARAPTPVSAPPAPTPLPATPVTSDQTLINIPLTQGMISAYLQFLQVQTQTGKQKLEYMRRRDEREEKESTQRRNLEQARMEREAAEFEHTKHAANVKQRADRAIELLGSSVVDASVKQAAGDYLKKLFLD